VHITKRILFGNVGDKSSATDLPC